MSPLLKRVLLVLLTTFALLVFAVAALTSLGCCAIDPERFPEQAARNQRRQERASLVALASLVTAVGAAVAAVRVGRGSRAGGRGGDTPS
jgi:hypothetical protein